MPLLPLPLLPLFVPLQPTAVAVDNGNNHCRTNTAHRRMDAPGHQCLPTPQRHWQRRSGGRSHWGHHRPCRRSVCWSRPCCGHSGPSSTGPSSAGKKVSAVTPPPLPPLPPPPLPPPPSQAARWRRRVQCAGRTPQPIATTTAMPMLPKEEWTRRARQRSPPP